MKHLPLLLIAFIALKLPDIIRAVGETRPVVKSFGPETMQAIAEFSAGMRKLKVQAEENDRRARQVEANIARSWAELRGRV